MNEHLKDWKVHALAFVLTLIAELIATQRINLGITAFSLFPMLYVLVFGAILGGGVHDYMCGMISLRHDGASIAELSGLYLGKT